MQTVTAWLFEFGGATLLALGIGFLFGYVLGRLANPGPIRWMGEDPDPIPLVEAPNVIDLRSRAVIDLRSKEVV